MMSGKPTILRLYIRDILVIFVAFSLIMIALLLLVHRMIEPHFYRELYRTVHTSFQEQSSEIAYRLLRNEISTARDIVQEKSFMPFAVTKHLTPAASGDLVESMDNLKCDSAPSYFDWGFVCKKGGTTEVNLYIKSADYHLGTLTAELRTSLATWPPYQIIRNGIFASILLFALLVALITYRFKCRVAAPINRAMKKVRNATREEDFRNILEAIPTSELHELSSQLAGRSSELAKIKWQLTESKYLASLGEIARLVAHDVRTPLQTLEFLLEDNLSKLHSEDKRLVENSIQRIRAMVDHVNRKTVYSDTIPLHHKLKLSPYPVCEAIQTVAEEQSVIASGNIHLEIEADSGDTDMFVCANLDRLEFIRVISNILRNSIESIPEEKPGSIMITVTSGKNDLLISIKDNGVGIPATILPRVTERGYSQSKPNGSGMGLYQSKIALESMNGVLSIESKVGIGTTVTVKLPVVKKPKWLVDSIDLRDRSEVFILDDDTSAHNAWTKRLRSLHYPGKIRAFTKASEFKASTPASDKKRLHLIDYQMGETEPCGTEIINKYHLADQGVLVTAYPVTGRLQEDVTNWGIRVLPKSLAQYTELIV